MGGEVTLVSFAGVAVQFGARELLRDVSLVIGRGERWGVLGRNGSGKTTLFNLITGELLPSGGTVVRASGLRVTVMDQHRAFGEAETVWAAAAGAFAELFALERSLGEQMTRMAEAGEGVAPAMLDRYDRDLARFEREGGYAAAARVDAVLHGLGFDPDGARSQRLATLSGGERGRVALAQQLAAPADLLLLDEPTNHLDLETTLWLEGYLRSLDAAVLLITHDRALLAALADHILHIEARTATAYAAGYTAFLTQRAERRLAQRRSYAQQAAKIAKEEDYIRRNIAGQNTRQAQGRRKRLERLPRLGPPPGAEDVMTVRLEAKERGGDQVLVAEDVRIAFGERVLLRGFGATVRRGEVVGLVGANGAGKSTLLTVFTGERAPEGGAVRVPESVTIAHYRQDLAQVPGERTLYDAIADRRGSWTRGQVQGHLGRFGFSGDAVLRRCGTLSGGERARMALALLELDRANLVVFDEPTNHLDVESIEALEEAIADFDGTVILVSHDRVLLRALTTRVWVLHEGRIADYPGTFAEWEVVSAERAHAARVAAQEEEALRRLKEQRQLRRGQEARKEDQAAQRAARRSREAAEAEVARCEAEVERVKGALADPDLYLTPEGVRRAAELGKTLDVAQRTLDAALEAWYLNQPAK
jgi:ATP-binding cassette subfamily F protein 3